MSETLSDLALGALRELSGVFARMPNDCADELIDAIITARKIVLFGCGREGLQMRGLAMRLFHLGRDATVWGDMSMAYKIAGGDAGGSHPVPAGCCSPPSCIHAQSR